jgi:hypothetical protein
VPSTLEQIPEFVLYTCIDSLFTLFIFTGLEQRFYKTDIDCVAAGKPLPAVTFLCLPQARTWIYNVLCHRFFFMFNELR